METVLILLGIPVALLVFLIALLVMVNALTPALRVSTSTTKVEELNPFEQLVCALTGMLTIGLASFASDDLLSYGGVISNPLVILGSRIVYFLFGLFFLWGLYTDWRDRKQNTN